MGLTLLPLRGPVTPALSLELGHAQPANTEGLERRLSRGQAESWCGICSRLSTRTSLKKR